MELEYFEEKLEISELQFELAKMGFKTYILANHANIDVDKTMRFCSAMEFLKNDIKYNREKVIAARGNKDNEPIQD